MYISRWKRFKSQFRANYTHGQFQIQIFKNRFQNTIFRRMNNNNNEFFKHYNEFFKHYF